MRTYEVYEMTASLLGVASTAAKNEPHYALTSMFNSFTVFLNVFNLSILKKSFSFLPSLLLLLLSPSHALTKYWKTNSYL